MFIKTKKFVFAIVFAFAALFLVACQTNVKPASITVEPEIKVAIGDQYVLDAVVKDEKDVVIVSPVKFSIADSAVAKVSADGTVTGVALGNTKVTVTSALDETITAEVTIKVVAAGTDLDIIDKAWAWVQNSHEHLLYIDRSFSFDAYEENPEVEISYEYKGTTLSGGMFAYTRPATDDEITIKVTIKYGNESKDFDLKRYLVKNAAANDFIALELLKERIESHFNDMKNQFGALLVTSNIEVPGGKIQVSMPGKVIEVSVNWSSSYSLYLSKDGVYQRPSDDTLVTLTATLNAGNAVSVEKYDFTVKGYTAEEKIAIILNDTTSEYKKFTTYLGTKTSFAEKLNLPIYDEIFGAKIIWTSDDTTVLGSDGTYMNPDLAELTSVKLRSTIEYGNPTDLHYFKYTCPVLPVAVAPFANDYERTAYFLDLEAEIPTRFVYGEQESNEYELPTGYSKYPDVSIEWSLSDAGNYAPADNPVNQVTVPLTDSETELVYAPSAEIVGNTLVLQAQPLRYKTITLKATYSGAKDKNGNTVAPVSMDYVVVISVSTQRNTIILGGMFGTPNQSAGDTVNAPWDALQGYSYFDPAVGHKTNWITTGATGYGRWQTVKNGGSHGWSGYVVSVNDPVTGGYREFYVIERITMRIIGVDANGWALYDNAKTFNGVDGTGNFSMFFYNTLNVDVKVPITYLNDSMGTIKDYAVSQGGTAAGVARQASAAFDDWRPGFAATKDGEILYGNADGTLTGDSNIKEYVLDSDGLVVKGSDGKSKRQVEYIVIPAGGFGYTNFSQSSVPEAYRPFCTKGNIVTLRVYGLHPMQDNTKGGVYPGDDYAYTYWSTKVNRDGSAIA